MTTILNNRRKVIGAVCPACGAATLVGLDGDACALTATVDVRPLTRTGELLAVVDGRRTYHLAGGRLDRRDRWRIRTATTPVLPEHRCHAPIPDAWRLPPAPSAPRPVKEDW